MTDVETFVESHFTEILKAVAMFWDSSTFSEIIGEVVTDDDYLKATTIVGIAQNTHELHGDQSLTIAQIVEYLVEALI